MENQESAPAAHEQFDEEVDLRELFAVLWGERVRIAIGVVLSAVVSVSVALYLPNKYTSEALLAPRTDGGAGGQLGKLASQYGGLASLAGINLGGMGDQVATAVAIETLKSRQFFGKYLYNEVLIELMAADGWDASTNRVTIDESIFNGKKSAWVRNVDANRHVKPSVQEAHEVFIEESISVSEDSKTGFVSLAVTHYSPTVARDWADLIIQSVNEALRTQDVEEAENSIAFLAEQSEKTSLVSLTEVFAELIEEQTKTVMLANASDEYVFRVIDPPVVPELESEPRRALICLLGVLFGAILAVLFVLIRYYIRKESQAG